MFWGGVIAFSLSIVFSAFVDIGPAIYLYNEYIHFNKDCIFDINIEEKKISFASAGNVIESTFIDIKQIVIYLCPNDYRDTGLRFLATGAFLFARFELKTGQEFYVTSLMIPNLKEFVNGSFKSTPLILHPWLYSSIRLVNYFRKGKAIKEQELS